MKDYNENVDSMVSLADEMIELADKGLAECHDENCVSLFGLAKDCAYRIRMVAERESRVHHEKFGHLEGRSDK